MKYKNSDIDVRQVQKVELEILKEFDRICRKNKIRYHLFAGTLLGAIRHKGFIPWDDDIDVCMLRKDFDKFKEICKKELRYDFFLQTYETDKEFNRQFIKIRKNNTKFVEKNFTDSNIHQGFFIDVFALDNIKDGSFLGKVHIFLLYIFSRIQLLRVKNFCLNIENSFKKNIALIMHYSLKIIPKLWTDKLNTKISTLFNSKETEYVSHLQNGVTKERYYKYKMKRNAFDKTEYGEFEGLTFPIPSDYEEILTNLFGDYMQLPPENEQYPHHGIVEINFNINEGDEVNEKKI